MSLYERYTCCIEKHLESNTWTFKNDSDFTYMLEHQGIAMRSLGQAYYTLVANVFSIEEIRTFTDMNDSVGNPCMDAYNGFDASPTSIRYVYHAYRILSHMQSLGLHDVSICEIGGGYGGLCMALHTYASKFGLRIQSYTIIDLDVVLKLQQRVLSSLGYTQIQFQSADTYGQDISEGFLVSTYAFSEFEQIHRDLYVQHLFPQMTHGFIVWNYIPVYDIGKDVHIEPEEPQVSATYGNKYVYW